MSPEFISKWEHILEDVEKQKIPIQFIKKMVIKLNNKKQQTINIEKLLEQGLDLEQVEDVVGKKLHELDEQIRAVEFVLNIKSIADTVQPTTDQFLKEL